MADYLAGLLHRLKNAGATLGAVTAVMPHMCIRELVERSPIPLVDVVAETVREIRRRGLHRVALFGARFVVESSLFGQLEGIDVVMPSAEEIALIHETYFQMAAAGAANAAQHQALTSLAHKLLDRGAEAIVFAGTDLSLVFHEDNTDFPYLDCARLHVAALVGAQGSA
jgi:aspartate racemase